MNMRIIIKSKSIRFEVKPTFLCMYVRTNVMNNNLFFLTILSIVINYVRFSSYLNTNL